MYYLKIKISDFISSSESMIITIQDTCSRHAKGQSQSKYLICINIRIDEILQFTYTNYIVQRVNSIVFLKIKCDVYRQSLADQVNQSSLQFQLRVVFQISTYLIIYFKKSSLLQLILFRLTSPENPTLPRNILQ